MNNFLLIVPKKTRPTISNPRRTTKSRNRNPNVPWKSTSREGNKELEGYTSITAESQSDNGEELAVLRAQLDLLKLKHEEEMGQAQQKNDLLQTENNFMKDRTAKISLSVESIKDVSEKFHF